MGICLDTEANSAAQEAEESATDWKGGGVNRSGVVRTALSASHSMQNAGKVKFDPPKVPVIFVLGGPGSGKVTHCDTLMQEKKGIAHINMMDLLQQFAIGNEMQDFSQLSSKVVTEVLMLEIKMAPAAKAYLVSGFPRSMRDVVEYTEKIQVINGVILVSWRQAVLQKQIDYGARLGHVVLSLAKMELDNFFKNVMPVADYYDQSDMLIAVNGERAPDEVYKDFRTAVLEIFGAHDNQEALLNGVAGMGTGANEIPGSIVSVDTAPSQPKNVITAADVASNVAAATAAHHSIMGQQTSLYPPGRTLPEVVPVDLRKLPPIICVIGGPGSNKAILCLKAIATLPGWGHFSIGRLVRSIADSDPKANTENHAIKSAISDGEMVAKNSIDKLIERQLLQFSDRKGVLIDGYPRDVQQVKDFELKYNQRPPIVLLDCSKLQLGRGRVDDTVSSFRRRLELFRELTLPMLKTLDSDGRLTIVDGDTDSAGVQQEFVKVIQKNVETLLGQRSDAALSAIENIGKLYTSDRRRAASTRQSGNAANQATHQISVQDIEEIDVSPPGVVPTISHHMSLMNGHIGGGSKPDAVANATSKLNGGQRLVANGRPSFRNMLNDAEDPIDSYM